MKVETCLLDIDMNNSDNIFYMLREGKENSISSREIIFEDFAFITQEDSFIIRKILLGDQILKRITFPKNIIDAAVDIIINNKSINIINNELEMTGVPLYSLIISLITACKQKYRELKKFKSSKQIIIMCNKDNLIKALELSKMLKKKIVIDGRNITLKEYEKILTNYDINLLDNIDLEVNYQDQSNPISIKELYKTAVIVDIITKDIEKYNLSPLEQIIYAYDIVKNRVYKECFENKDSSRDLSQIIQNDYTVCVGHSNLLIAILENLGINAKPLISTKTKHQRSIVYIQDKKYQIDGVYVFDATFDSRKSSNYINNYNYFALLPSDSEKDAPSDTYNINNISYEELLSTYDEDEKDVITRIDDIKKREYILRKAFAFVKEPDYDLLEDIIKTYKFASPSERNLAFHIYSRYTLKYNPQPLSEITFFNALYNVRLLEVYTGIIDKVNPEDLIEVTRDRTVSQMVRYSGSQSKTEKLLKALEKDYQILNILNSELSQRKIDIERKDLNIKLLKVLQKVHNIKK